MPLAATNPPKVRIDDRCNYPSDPNPITDQPTGIYSRPQHNPNYQVAQIPDGTEVTLACMAAGDTIDDAVGNTSNIWIGVQIPDDGLSGFIPDVNIGGGYTAQQLAGLGVGECQ